MTSTLLKSCLDILRRTDPRDTDKNLANIATLLPSDTLAAGLLQRVDAPLKVAKDENANDRPFLLCDHNRDGDSHRSPWSNTHIPPLEEGFLPSGRLRKIEIHANEVFNVYRELYYGKNSVSSVYLWDKNGENATDGVVGFAGCFLIQKTVTGDENVKSGYWNSIHVVDVGNVRDGTCQYKLTTTIFISLAPNSNESTAVSGSLVRSRSKKLKATDESSHIVNVGQLIEDIEVDMRSEIDSLYIQKTRNVVEMIRKDSPQDTTDGKNHSLVLNEAVLSRVGKS